MVKLTGRFSLKLVCPLLSGQLGFLVASSFSCLTAFLALLLLLLLLLLLFLFLYTASYYLFWAYVDDDDDDGDDDDEYVDSGAVCV